jgi:hypothetical protein
MNRNDSVSIQIDKRDIPPLAVGIREPGFGLKHPSATHLIQIKILLSQWMNDFLPHYNSFLDDSRNDPDPDSTTAWLSELHFPKLGELVHSHPEKLSKILMDYFCPDFLVRFIHSDQPLYLLNQVDEIQFDSKSILISGKAISLSPNL